MLRWIGGLLLTSALALPAVATAGDISCFWQHLPAAARARYLSNYAEAGPDASRTAFSAAEIAQGMAPCQLQTVPVDLFAAALADDLWAVGAMSVLHDRFGVDERSLAAAWDALPTDERAAFQQQVLGKPSNPDIATVNAILTALHLPATAQGQVFVYVTSRIMLGDAEAKF
jgi:hypothetical protein